jgi:hypothetical protein
VIESKGLSGQVLLCLKTESELASEMLCHFKQGVYRVLMGERSLGRPKLRWEDNIKADLQEVGCGGLDWIELAQDRDMWWALVNVVMNLQIP